MPEETKTQEELDFDKYFDEAVAEDTPKQDIVKDPVEDPNASQTKEKEAPEEEEEEAHIEEDPLKDDPVFKPIPPENDDDPGANGDSKVAQLEADLQKERQKTASWEGRIRKANERAEAAEAAVKALKEKSEDKGMKDAPSQDDIPTGDDDAILQDFRDEFPDLIRPVEILANRIAEKMVQDLKGEISPTIESLQTTQEQSAQDLHLETITKAHPDWRDIKDSGRLKQWVSLQPAFVQESLVRVIKQGTAEEVIEMFDTYKQVNGITKNKPKGANPPSRADALLAVPGQSGGPPPDKPDANDFDSAWAEANSQK